MTLVAAGVALFGFDESVAIFTFGRSWWLFLHLLTIEVVVSILLLKASWIAPRIAGVN